MRGLRFILLVLVAIAGLTVGTGVGASTGKPNVAGPHIRNVVIKGGALSHGKIPLKVMRMLRSAADSPNCPGAIKTTSPTMQSCVWPADYTGSVTCIQNSNSAIVVQTCDASQIQTMANKGNYAQIAQVIVSKNPPSPQDGAQIVKLRQTATGTGSNTALIGQYIKQTLGPGNPDDTEEEELETSAAPVMNPNQSQDSHQRVHLRQISASGSNNAPILQFLRQRERANNVGGAITQSQNIANEGGCAPDVGSDGLLGVAMSNGANMCILSNQTSTTGRQNLLLTGDYNQFQRVHKATGGSQTQGDFNGGLDYGLNQDSLGVSNVLTIQNERQVQRAVRADVFQSQLGPVRKGFGSSQTGNPADVWRGAQHSTQLQTKRATPAEIGLAQAAPGAQANALEYFGTSTGDIRASQTIIQNGETTHWGCPPPGVPSDGPNNTCAAVVVCGSFGEGESGIGFLQVASACTPSCPEGTFFNSETGECEPSGCEIYCTDAAPASAPVQYARKR